MVVFLPITLEELQHSLSMVQGNHFNSENDKIILDMQTWLHFKKFGLKSLTD